MSRIVFREVLSCLSSSCKAATRLARTSICDQNRAMPRRRLRSLRIETLERREVFASGFEVASIDNLMPVAAINGLENKFVLSGDFDGNSYGDLLYVDKATGDNRIVLNRDNSRFDSLDNRIPQASINGLNDSNVVLAGDFDRNGLCDVAYVHKQTGENRIILNRGDFRFDSFDNRIPPASINGLNDSNIVLAGDFDGNGFSDILYIHKQTGGNRLLLNRGNFQFDSFDDRLPRGSINGLYDNHNVISGDFDGNGLNDVMYVHKQSGENRTLLNRGDFRFENRDNSVPNGKINGLDSGFVLVSGGFDRNADSELLYIRKSNGENRLLGHDFGLCDERLSGLMSTIYTGGISRKEMIQLLRSTGNDGSVNQFELTDLHLIVTPNTGFPMPAYVRDLGRDVVNSNPANARFQGGALGNLGAGSSANQLNRLIDKWFFGADVPAIVGSGISYGTAAGNLIIGTPARFDAAQGAIGDCYFVAALLAIADSQPSAVRNMFLDNGDGTYTVRFYAASGVADYVTVNRQLPTYSSGMLAYGGQGMWASSQYTKLWLPLIEKAYAQWNETGNAGRNGTNTFAGIEGGWMSNVNRQVLGKSSADFFLSQSTKEQLIASLGGGRAVTIGTRSSSSNGLFGSHAYIVTGYDAASDRFMLHNPWGSYHPAPLSWSQLVFSCYQYCVTNTSGTSSISLGNVVSPPMDTPLANWTEANHLGSVGQQITPNVTSSYEETDDLQEESLNQAMIQWSTPTRSCDKLPKIVAQSATEEQSIASELMAIDFAFEFESIDELFAA